MAREQMRQPEDDYLDAGSEEIDRRLELTKEEQAASAAIEIKLMNVLADNSDDLQAAHGSKRTLAIHLAAVLHCAQFAEFKMNQQK